MAAIDIESLLNPVTPDAPCGDDLEYDPLYGELERATQGKPEQQFGDTLVPAEEPDWPQVQRLAIQLLARTKDLRVAAHLTRALARNEGWEGFRDGLRLTLEFIQRHWEELHPRLDPDEDLDPTLRVNTLLTLCDSEATLDGLRAAPLVRARGIGSFSLRDIQIANKELQPPKDGKTPVPEPQLIAAAFQEAELEALQATALAVRESLNQATAMEALLVEKIGIDATPDFAPLTDLIRLAQKAIGEPLAERTGASETPAESGDAPDSQPAADAPATGTTIAGSSIGAINSRADVARALDALCDYYRRQEPSSPIPLLLQRAKRLVSKDFLEILADLAPDGLSQAKSIRGPESDA